MGSNYAFIPTTLTDESALSTEIELPVFKECTVTITDSEITFKSEDAKYVYNPACGF